MGAHKSFQEGGFAPLQPPRIFTAEMMAQAGEMLEQ